MSERAVTAVKSRVRSGRTAHQARARAVQPPQRISAPWLPVVDTVLQSGGEPLDPRTRALMERRFGCDFREVRVHADARAARSAELLHAHAYVVGRHVVLNTARHDPHYASSLPLLAHELAHVVQQNAAHYSPRRPLALMPSSSHLEDEAHRAASRVRRGAAVRISGRTAPGGVQALQRAEHGTYVSQIGESPYLDAGAQFYRTWGHPNVRRVSNMKQVLDDLDTAKGTIDKFRIVSHGSEMGLELGLLPDIAKDYFFASPTATTPTTQYTTEERFRADFTSMRVVAESKFREVYDALWMDASTQPLVATIGGTKSVPSAASDLGILLRAIVDDRFIATATLDTGKPARIPNAGALKTFNTLRQRAYGRRVVEAKPKDEQQTARQAIVQLGRKLPAAMTTASVSFGALSADDAKSLADPFVEKGSLKKGLGRAIEEGAGGPFLKKLKSVRSKINTKTHIEIRGCNVGKKPETMDGLRGFFGNPDALPSLSAPDLYQFFFQLNLKTYHKDQEAALEAAYDDPTLGVKAGFEDLTRMKAGEMIRLHVGGKLAELAARYGFNADRVRKLNPEVEKPDELKPGDMLWLVQRQRVPAGIYKTLEQLCRDYLGNPHAWPAVWKVNPWLQDPRKLGPTDQVTLPLSVLAKPFASIATGRAEFVAAVRGGQAVSGLASEIDETVRTGGRVRTERRRFANPRPVLHLDEARRNEALGKWLVAQRFDPKGRTAEVLSRRFGKSGAEFERGRSGTYVQFLTRSYPNAEDPIFPEDPRYEKHIKQRP